MTSGKLLRRIGILAAAIFFTASIGTRPLFAIDNDKAASAKAASEEKAADKKKARKQTGTAQSTGGNTAPTGAAPMSGFRPDPVSNY